MKEQVFNDTACEPTAALTYGMSSALLNSGLLGKVNSLNHEDKVCLIRYIRQTEEQGLEIWEDLDDGMAPYTMEELNSRIDEAEAEIDRSEGKSFNEMMDGFRRQLLWLK